MVAQAVKGAAKDARSAGVSSVQVISLYRSDDRIYARAVHGWFAAWRWAMVWATQLVFYGTPWLEWNARQAVLFDLEARRFYLFGLVLYPQDFIYLTGLLIVSAYALFLFTAVAGRLWCGYACPQTVYTEIFMWIERRFEGDRQARMKRDAGGWTLPRFTRAAGKHAVWGAVALWTGLSFVGYFTPIRQLVAAIPAFALGPWESFWVLFYGLATYGNAGWMREQVCKYMCPYARFQSAMFDKDTLVIGYDAVRGEARGPRGRKTDLEAAGLGDCIDCGLCVQVCPTGIDIRKGLQYECIGCAACADVCDGVMDKMGYSRGLVRYDTSNGLAQGLPRTEQFRRLLRPRVLIYTAVLALIGAALMASLALRNPFRVDVVRDRASLARLVDDGWVENVYRLQIMNALERPQQYRVQASGLTGAVTDEQTAVQVGPAEARWATVSVRIPPETARLRGAGAHAMQFDITRLADGTDASSVLVSEHSTFIVPR